MTLAFTPSELRQFSENHGVLMWDLGEDYCLLDWMGIGLPKPTSYSKSFVGLVTRKKYLGQVASLEELAPQTTLDSFLLLPIQLAKFLRWPPDDPILDDLLSGPIGWVPAEAGPVESRLPAAAQNLFSKIRTETDFKTVPGARYTLDIEIMAAALNTLFDPSSAAKVLLGTYGSKLEEIAQYPQHIITHQDVQIRLDSADTIRSNLKRGHLYGRTHLSPSVELDHYAGGPNLLLFTLPQQPKIAAQALADLIKNIAIYWQKIIPA